MKILALDVATRCGVAFGQSDAAPRAWSIDLGKGRSEEAAFAKAIRMTAHYCAKYEPDVVAIEAPIGGRNANRKLIGLWACVMGQAEAPGRTVIRCDISSVRKHFLGKHLTTKHFPGHSHAQAKKQIKSAVINQCRALGWSVDGDDAADACAIWSYAVADQSSLPVVHTSLFGGAHVR